MSTQTTINSCQGYSENHHNSRCLFAICDDTIFYYKVSDSDSYDGNIGLLYIPDLNVINTKENNFILTGTKTEKYFLSANSPQDKNFWISELTEKGATLERPNFSGYLEKWGTVVYNKRWFVLCDQYISYYDSESEDVFKGCMLLKEAIVVDNFEEGDSDGVKFILTDGKVKHYLKATTSEEKLEWISELQEKEVRSISLDDMKDIEYYGELVPALSFPNNFDIRELGEREESQRNYLMTVETIVATIAENGFQAVVEVILPYGGLAYKGSCHAITGARKIFDSFVNVSIKDITPKLKEKRQKEHFENSLKLMRAEMAATQKRYENLFLNKFSLEEKKAEIPVAVQSFERTLELFKLEEGLFFSNALLMAPFLKEFAVLFLSFCKLASLLHPNYKNELCEQLNILVTYLKSYKVVVIQERLSAISCGGDSLGKRVLSMGKLIVNLPDYLYVVYIHGEDKYRFAMPGGKVTDDLYPTPSGIQSRSAYPRRDVHIDGDNLYEKYKAKIEAIYNSYFDNIIDDILRLISTMDTDNEE